MAPKRTRRNKKQKGGVLTYEQEQYLQKKEANRKAQAAVRQANASRDPVVGLTSPSTAKQWKAARAAGLTNKRATGKRKRKN